jgi:hypothetical protein
MAVNPGDDVRVGARGSCEAARPQRVGEITANSPALVGMHGHVLRVSMSGQEVGALHKRPTNRPCLRASPSV